MSDTAEPPVETVDPLTAIAREIAAEAIRREIDRDNDKIVAEDCTIHQFGVYSRTVIL